MGQYAAKTKVTVAKSKVEIEGILKRYGADGFISGWQGDRAAIGFTMGGRQIRLEVAIPPIRKTNSAGHHWSKSQAEASRDLEERQRWRALCLIVKAKLEAADSGISTIEREFLADIVLPDNTLVGDMIKTQLEATYATGKMPPLLPEPKKSNRAK